MKKILMILLLAICFVSYRVKADTLDDALINQNENPSLYEATGEEQDNYENEDGGELIDDNVTNETSDESTSNDGTNDLKSSNLEDNESNNDSVSLRGDKELAQDDQELENNNQNDTTNALQENNLTEENTQTIPQQKVLVKISKVDENGLGLAGATLQVLDSSGVVIDEWVSNGEIHELQLTEGKYTLHEKEAPEGYDLAEDKEFEVTVIMEIGYKANTEYPNVPCQVATTYYVELEGKKHEVYCINQFLTEPGHDADYNGKILNPDDVRNYTKQVVLKDPLSNPGGAGAVAGHGHLTDTEIDVSDTNLNNKELYDVLLDIIYRRTLAREQERFADSDFFPDEAISYITEAALKTYTNAGVTQIQRWNSLQPGEEAMYVKEGNYYWYLMHMYKDYVYDPTSPYGWKTEIGHGDALGNFARHWAGSECLKDENGACVKDENNKNIEMHGTRNLSVDHPEYAEFYYYLLGDEVSKDMKHPRDMHIYIYSALNVDSDGEKYQNLLGITGYLEDLEPQVLDVSMTNNYSKEKVDVTIKKVWDDNNNQDGIRPTNIKATLSNGETVILSEENNWTATITNLPKYDKAKLISYTWQEVNVDGYKLSDTVVDGYITTLTNKHTIEVTEVKVTKVWADDDNESKKRPKNIQVALLMNNEELEIITLDESNNWEYIFSDLPKYKNGEEIVYTILEKNIPEGYVASYEGDMKTGFIIHNVLGQGGDVPPTDNPKTGDNILYYVITIVISLIGLLLCIRFTKKYN